MPRDVALSASIADRLASLRADAIASSTVETIKQARKAVSAAGDARLRAAAACHNLAGTQGTAEQLDKAKAEERDAQGALHRARCRPYDAADAAVLPLAEIVSELAAAAFEVAALLRDLQQAAALSGRQHSAYAAWSGVDASAAGLRSVAEHMAPPRRSSPVNATLRWTRDTL